MKVSIITLHYILNYGSVLQTYATQKKIESLGFNTEVVNYVRENIRRSNNNVLKPSNLVVLFISLIRKKLITDPKTKHLNDFLKDNVNLSRPYKDYESLKLSPPIADIYCTGSDQMWNSQYNGGILPEYFLEYAPAGKTRVAYSTSFGRTDLSDNELCQTSKLIQKYRGISVRESSALVLLKKMKFNKGINILDPTLVLTHEQWKSIIAKRKIKYPYVFLYQLNINREMERFAKKIAKEKHCKLVTLTSSVRSLTSFGKTIYGPSVNEFLSLIDNAEYVVTDSFHGTAFSLNFNKQLFVFYPPLYKTRLESILSLVGQQCRAIDNSEVEIDSIPAIDYNIVNCIFEKERSKASTFIKENFKI